MNKNYRIYQVDSFTRDLFSGNPAGVVANADGLTDHQMQQIARELNNSETAFILSPETDNHDVWLRFFTPRVEVPICGHATVAAHYIRAQEKNLDTCTIMHRTGAGILPLDIVKENNDYKIYMTQGKIEFRDPFEADIKDRICSALGITSNDLDDRCPVQVASTGHSKVMIGIKSKELLNNLQPDMHSLALISREINCNGYFVFKLNSEQAEVLSEGRMFAPAIGINEDPVTGNANGPLGAYLLHHKIVSCSGDYFRFRAKQGEAINRPGIVEVEVKIDKGNPVKVKIGGEAVIVFKTEMLLDSE